MPCNQSVDSGAICQPEGETTHASGGEGSGKEAGRAEDGGGAGGGTGSGRLRVGAGDLAEGLPRVAGGAARRRVVRQRPAVPLALRRRWQPPVRLARGRGGEFCPFVRGDGRTGQG